MFLFHILSALSWRRAQGTGCYRPASLESEGFVHLSEEAQLARTAERFFADQDDLLVLRIDPARLEAELRYEEADGESFPHLYGALNLDAVVEVESLADRLGMSMAR